MSYSAYDPRDELRQKIGTVHYDTDLHENLYTIVVEDDNTRNVYIPMYLSEEVDAGVLPVLPFCELQTVKNLYAVRNVGGNVRKDETILDIHIYFTDDDNITAVTFSKAIRDTLQNLVRCNQCSMPETNFMTIESDTLLTETDGSRTILHYVCTVYLLYYDLSDGS